LGRARASDLRTWIDQLKIKLFYDTTTVLRVPQIVRLWSRDPLGVAINAQFGVWQNPLLTTLGFQQTPFGQDDWPNPRGAAFPIDLRTFLQTFDVQLIGQDTFFGGPGQAPANLDWPVPKGYIPSISLRTWIDRAHCADGGPAVTVSGGVTRSCSPVDPVIDAEDERIALMAANNVFEEPWANPENMI
jgi:hypothetical protein